MSDPLAGAPEQWRADELPTLAAAACTHFEPRRRPELMPVSHLVGRELPVPVAAAGVIVSAARSTEPALHAMDGPALRVSYNRIALQLVDRHPKGKAIRADVPVAAILAIEEGFRFGWLAIEHHMGLIEAVRRQLGDREAYDFWRRTTLENFISPAFQIPLSAIRRLFGLTPASLASQSARYWPRYARELGEMRLGARGEGFATLELAGFPGELLRGGTWVIGMAGGLAAYFTLCEVEGTCEPKVVDARRGRVDFEMRWTPSR